MRDPECSQEDTLPGEKSRQEDLRSHVTVLAGYVLLTLLYTFPLVFNLSESTLSQALGLNYAVMSNAALIDENLAAGTGVLSSSRIFYPTGYTLHEGLLPSLLVFVLGAGRDFLVGLNLSILFSFILTAWGGYLLAWELTRSRWGAVLGGIYFGFGAHHFGNVGVYPIFHLQWLPLFFWAVIRYAGSGRRAYLLGVAAFFIAASLSSWYFTVLIGLVLGLALPFYLWRNRQVRRGGVLLAVLAFSCLALIPLNPAVLLGRDGLVSGGFKFVVDGSADLLSFVVPHSEHWALWTWSRGFQEDWLGNRSLQMNYLGSASLLLALSGVAVWRRSARVKWFLVLAGGIFLVMSLGPYLAVNGLPGFDLDRAIDELDAVRLPFYWLADWFPFRVTRAVSRYSIVTGLVLAIFLASGAGVLADRRKRLIRAVAVAVVAAMLTVEFLPVWPMRLVAPVPPSPFYRTLAAGTTKDGKSIVELPFRPSSYRMLYYSTFHRRQVIGGAVDKPFVRFDAEARRRPLLRRLSLASVGEQRPSVLNDVYGPRWPDYALADAADLGLKYAIVHRHNEFILSFGDYFVDEPMVEIVEAALAPGFEPCFEDRLIRVFELRERPVRWIYPILGSGWGRLEDHGSYVDRPLLGDRAAIEIRASEAGRLRLELDLSLILVPERTLELVLNGDRVLVAKIPARREPGQVETVVLTGVPIRAGSNFLEVRTPDPVPSIAEVYRGNDHRRIAVLLNRLDVGFTETTVAPEPN